MKVFIISFGPNPRIVAKFQTHRFRTFGENRGEKIKKIKNKETFGRLVNHIPTQRRCYIRSAVAGGVNNNSWIGLLDYCCTLTLLLNGH